MALLKLLRVNSMFVFRSSLFCHSKLHTSTTYLAANVTAKGKLYETLGVSSSASQNEIKKAYYDLTLKYHPDRNENCEVAATKFREVAEAYEILGNYGLRKKYDQGVPLTIVKKNIKKTVDHHVKYQTFFDSRAKPSAKAQAEEIHAYGSSNRNAHKKYFEDREKEVYKNLNTVQFVAAVFLSCVVFFSRYYGDD